MQKFPVLLRIRGMHLRQADSYKLHQTYGGRKSVTNEMEYHVILNKADTKEQKKLARKIAEAIIEQAQMSERKRECSENQAHSVVKSVHITDWLYSK